MVKLNTKIKASSLIEVIVALLIILIVYAILTFFIGNISKQLRNNNDKIEAYFIVEKTINETIQNNQFYDDEFVINDITFIKRVVKYQNYNDLYDLKISVYNKNKKLLIEMREIIYYEKNN